MPKVPMFSKPNMTPDIAVAGLKVLELPKGWSFTVAVDFDAKVYKSIEKDTILLKEMNEAAAKAYKQTCDSVKSKYTSFEKLVQGMIDKGAPKPMVENQIKGLNKSLEDDRKIGQIGAEQAIMAVWKQYSAKNKEYTKYKIKIVVTIVGAAAGLATSIGLMASSPFTGGLSAAVGIISMIKSSVTLVKEIGSACLEVEKSQAVLKKYLIPVEAAAKKVAASKANEYSAAIAQQFLGIAQPNIKGCDSQLKTIVQKLNGLEIKTHNVGKNLNGILDKQQQMRTEFMKEVTAKLSKHPSREAPNQIRLIESRLDDLLAKSYQAVQDSIAKVESLYDRFKEAQKTTDDLNKRVKPLLALRGLDNTILENVLYLVDLPLNALKGNVWATQASDLISGLVPVGSLMTYDKLSGAVLDKTLLA